MLLLFGLAATVAGAEPSPGRFQLVAAQITDHDGTRARLFRIDTSTGEVCEFVSVGLAMRDSTGQSANVSARGWTPIPADFWAEFDRVKRLGEAPRQRLDVSPSPGIPSVVDKQLHKAR